MVRIKSSWDAQRDGDALYRQFLLRDRANDGKFLTGVISTGIYCLPSCPARRPKRENVRFFHDPAEARESGLRPCFRCRPDSFYRGEEFHENLFEQTAARVRANPGKFRGIAAVARAAGLSRTAVNDLFREHAHESPGAFLRRVRVEAVCEALQKGEKPGDAAAAAGFGGASSFHQQFLARTGLTPAAYASLRDASEFTLKLPKDYRTREILAFFGRDQEGVSERVGAHGFSKCFEVDGCAVVVEVEFGKHSAQCRTDAGFAYAAHDAVLRMLGFESDAAAFERQFAAKAGKDKDAIAGMFRDQRGLRIPCTPQPWEALGWAIIGQQISLQVAVTLRRGLISALGLEHPSGLKAFPSAETVAKVDVEFLRGLKFSKSKAEYIIGAAQAVVSGAAPLMQLRELSAHHAARMLGAIRGIGPWTVQYVFLRGAGFADCLPAGDAGLARGLAAFSSERPDEAGVKQALDRFAPFRSLAACHVWASLNNEHGG
jgi:AraC family transcriptional regulator, regulatory protein of adaptative response / DNA-3-methyladenine glycosylase II